MDLRGLSTASASASTMKEHGGETKRDGQAVNLERYT